MRVALGGKDTRVHAYGARTNDPALIGNRMRPHDGSGCDPKEGSGGDPGVGPGCDHQLVLVAITVSFAVTAW